MKRSSAAVKRKAPGEADERRLDFDELPTYLGYQVRRAQAKIFAEFEATLGDLDFTPGSFGVLTLIRANPGITQVALAAAFGVDKSTMSPVIVRLEKRGLVRREVLASDRRCHALFFQPAAEAAFLAAREKFRALEAGVAARLTKPEQRELSRLLAKLRDGADGSG
jgi:DNA-binding MarR family transcriptional regulator